MFEFLDSPVDPKLYEDFKKYEKEKKNHLMSIKLDIDELRQKSIKLSAIEIQCNAEKQLYSLRAEEDTSKINDEISCLHTSLLHHHCLYSGIQNITQFVQMQESFYASVKSDISEESVEHLTTRKIIAKSDDNLKITHELKSVINKNHELHEDILNYQKVYDQLLKEIETEWRSLTDNSHVHVQTEDSTEVKKFKETIREIEQKMHIMITFLQALICGGGFDWGRNNHFIEILMMCELWLSPDVTYDKLLESSENLLKSRKIEGKSSMVAVLAIPPMRGN